MPTLRKRMSRQPLAEKITPETVELYRRILEIREAGQDEKWEGEGERRRELCDCEVALMRALQLRPWHYVPTDVPLDGPPEPWEDPARHAIAQELRQALQAALGAAG